jgi:hypothetical protein
MGSKCLDLMDKSKTPSHYGFPLANPHFAESVDVVPESNSFISLFLLYICLGNTQSVRPSIQQITTILDVLNICVLFMAGF